MNLFAIVVLAAAAGLGMCVAGVLVVRRRSHPAHRAGPVTDTRQILLPFTGQTLSRRAFEAALRLARVEEATLMPAFIATVPLTLTIDSPLPRQCLVGMPLLEVIEQRALAQGVAVDSRVSRGRSYRDALRRLLASEHFDRVIISATGDPAIGLTGQDLLWLLERAQAEVLILRPAPVDTRVLTPSGISGHF